MGKNATPIAEEIPKPMDMPKPDPAGGRRKPGKRSLGWVQLNVQVPEDLRTKAKIKALQDGKDLSDVITTLLQKWTSDA